MARISQKHPFTEPAMREYAKGKDAKATIGEAKALAESEVFPAFVAARFALIVAFLAMVVSAVALAIAVAK